MPKLTSGSGIAGEPVTAVSTGDKLPLLPKPMNCPENCAEWQANAAKRDPELLGCSHSMTTQELKEWLALLRPSRIAISGREPRGKKGVDDEVSI